MPRNQFQRMIFALITVVITVHAYVFYSLYFPFAFFTQLFFIQPAVRVLFKLIFAKDIKTRTEPKVTATA